MHLARLKKLLNSSFKGESGKQELMFIVLPSRGNYYPLNNSTYIYINFLDFIIEQYKCMYQMQFLLYFIFQKYYFYQITF